MYRNVNLSVSIDVPDVHFAHGVHRSKDSRMDRGPFYVEHVIVGVLERV